MEQPKTIYLYGKPSTTVNVDVATVHDQAMVERCLVKIGLNFLFHHFPSSHHNQLLNKAISYVKTGKRSINTFIPETIGGLDTSQKKIHYVIIFQGVHGVIITTSLFSSKLRFSFAIDNLKVMATGAYSKLEVDYEARKNTIFPSNSQF